MAAVQIRTIETSTPVSHTGNTDWSVAQTINSANIDAATYLIIFCNLCSGDNMSGTHSVQLFEGGGAIAGTYNAFKPADALAQYNHRHAGWAVHTFTGSSNMTVQIKNNTLSTDTVYLNYCYVAMIKIDATDTAEDALHSTDFAYDYVGTQVDSVANSWQDATDGMASITIGDGVSDWLVLGTFNQRTGSSIGTFDVKLMVDDVDREILEQTRNNTSSIRIQEQIMTVLSAPAADTVVEAAYRSNSALGDCFSNGVMAIRLNAFDDHAITRQTAGVSISSTDTDTVGDTLTHTTDHTSGSDETWFFMGFSQISEDDNNKRIESMLDQAGTDLSGDRSDWQVCRSDQNASGGAMGVSLLGTKSISHNTDVDVDMIHREEADVTPAPVIEITNIVGFTLTKASDQASSLPLLGAASNAGF